jgi:hypothetical protein
VLARLRDTDAIARRWRWAGVAVLVLLVPLLFLGPGNDLDVANVFRSGRSIVLHHHYRPSRAPGAPVHETAVGVLDWLGGPRLTNLGSLVMAAVCAVALFTLLRREGVRNRGLLAIAVVVLNPWFIIAATSTVEYLWALAFVLLAANALRRDRAVLAGALGALSMGCRVGSGLLIVAMLLAEAFEGRAARRRIVVTAAVATAGTVLMFVPSYLAAGSSLQFAQNDFTTSTPLVQVGRTLSKDLLLLGPIGLLVLLATVPALVATLRRWRSSWLLRFAAPGLVLSQLLFLRFPWKMPHLLPCLLCLAIWLAVAFDDAHDDDDDGRTAPGAARLSRRRPPLLEALVVTQVLYLGLRIDLIEPNAANNATGGRLAPAVGWGPVIVDLRCRSEQPHAYLGPQKPVVERAWNCAKPFGG